MVRSSLTAPVCALPPLLAACIQDEDGSQRTADGDGPRAHEDSDLCRPRTGIPTCERHGCGLLPDNVPVVSLPALRLVTGSDSLAGSNSGFPNANAQLWVEDASKHRAREDVLYCRTCSKGALRQRGRTLGCTTATGE